MSTINHAQYLDERKEMMQWYADHLDELIASSVCEPQSNNNLMERYLTYTGQSRRS